MNKNKNTGKFINYTERVGNMQYASIGLMDGRPCLTHILPFFSIFW